MARAAWIWLALGAALIGALAPASGQARTWKVADPLRAGRPLVMQSEGVAVILTPPTAAQLDQYEQAEEPAEGEEYPAPPPVTITVRFPGQPPFAVPADPNRLDAHGIAKQACG